MAAGDITDAMVARIRERIGEVATSGLLDSEIISQLNRAQSHLATHLCDEAMPELKQTVEGNLTASQATLPSDFWRERLLTVAGVYANKVNVSELDNINDASASNVYYYIWGATGNAVLVVEMGDPASTVACKLWYMRYPTTVSTSVDPDFTEPNRWMLEDFAVAECLRMRQRHAEAETVIARYMTMIRTVNSRYRLGEQFEGHPGDPSS